MRVVHCKREPYTHYIGRGSRFGNRYSHRPSKYAYVILVPTPEEAVRRYKVDARNDPELRKAIYALPESAVLGCFCKIKGDEPCHGDVIMELWQEMHAGD